MTAVNLLQNLLPAIGMALGSDAPEQEWDDAVAGSAQEPIGTSSVGHLAQSGPAASRAFLTGSAARERAQELARTAPEPPGPKADGYVSLADAIRSGEVEVLAVSGNSIYVVNPQEVRDPAKREEYIRRAQEAEAWIARNDPTGQLMSSLDGSRLGSDTMPRMILMQTPERGDDAPYPQLFEQGSNRFTPAEAQAGKAAEYGSNFDRIVWSPERGIRFADGSSASPAATLAHELYHNLQVSDARASAPRAPLQAVVARMTELGRDSNGNGTPDVEDDATTFERNLLLRAAREDPSIKPRESYGTEVYYDYVAPRVTSTDGEPVLQEPSF